MSGVFGGIFPMAGAQGAAGSTVAVTTYAQFLYPTPGGDPVLVDVGDGSTLTAGMWVILIRNNAAGAIAMYVVDSEGGQANQAQLSAPVGLEDQPPPGATIPAGTIYITGPRGPSNPSFLTVAVNSTATGATGAEVSPPATALPMGADPFPINKVTLFPFTALSGIPTSNPLLTNFGSVQLNFYGPDGSSSAVIIDLATHTSAAGRFCLTGDIVAHGAQEVDVSSAGITMAGGWSCSPQVLKVGSFATPAMRLDLSTV